MSLRKDLENIADDNEVELNIPGEPSEIVIEEIEEEEPEKKDEQKDDKGSIEKEEIGKENLVFGMDKEDIQLEVQEQPKEIKPRDTKEDSDSSQDEKTDSSSKSSEDSEESEIYYKIEVKFNLVQRIFQQIIRFEGAFTPTILFKPVFPPMNHYITGVLEAASCPINAVVGDVLVALTRKENPLSGLKALGDDNTGIGFIINTTSTVVAISTMTIVGYGVHCLITAYAPEIILSENQSLHTLGMVLSNEAFKAAVIGLGCYSGAEVIKAIGMKIWDCCIPSNNEPIENPKNLYLMQIAGGYLVGLFGKISGAEAVLFYLDLAGLQAISSVARYQNIIFLGKSGVSDAVEYLACTPHPFNALVPEKERTEIIKGRESLYIGSEKDEDEELEVILEPSNRQIAKYAGLRTLSKLAFLAGAYVVSEITCYLADSQGSGLCTENTLGNRIGRYAITLGVPLAADFIVNHGAKKIKSALQNYCPTFFSSAPKDNGFYPLIQEEDGLDDPNDNSLLRNSL